MYIYTSISTCIYKAIYLNISTGGHPPRDRALQQRQAQGQGGDQAGTHTYRGGTDRAEVLSVEWVHTEVQMVPLKVR